ncbi:MAG: hypothetical protein A2283_23405 [Lentisphaerae bacterium RIFOXYA12_FULL_48_11]|nr:MAG: hypothetical protein A2283_23405 [Lentisphaerae bacterium RIFOXYA12_FULL_48_11]
MHNKNYLRFRIIFILLLFPFVNFTLAGTDWPEFRGPLGNGYVSAEGDVRPLGLPLKWGEGENIKWKTEIHDSGWSTPVVMGGQVWLTTATTNGYDFYAMCVDAETGKILFNEQLFHCDKPEPLGQNVNCYASPSPVIENGRVYISFGSYGTACLDTSTFKTIWERTDISCRHYRGPGSSPILFEDLLILTMDGADLQYLTALDKKTGKTVWKTDRSVKWDDLGADGKPKIEGDYRKAFSTPFIVDVKGKKQLICPGSKAAYSYDPCTGKELWICTELADYSVAARPVYGNGMVYVMTGQGKAGIKAIRIDGQGEVSGTHVAWKVERGGPKLPSPLLIDGFLYFTSADGFATCLDASTGALVWKERLGGTYAASPVYGDGRMYFFNQQGASTVLKPGRTYEVLATNRLDVGCMASPAVSGKALFVRTKTHLYRIEEK